MSKVVKGAAIPFGPEGCKYQLHTGRDRRIGCGETQSLAIVNEFRRLYEEKLQEIDREAGGEPTQVCF